MAYSRRQVTDYVTIMNKDLYDNLQDGIDEVKKVLEGFEETVVTSGSGYGEVGIWYDGNPSSEDRLYRFVTIEGNNREIGIANSTDQIVGTSNVISNIGFLGNYHENDENDPTKVIVSILGVSYVKTGDNTIVANDRVMSDDNGYAVKSSNNIGYRVLRVVETGLLEIVIFPNTDMIQRIRTKIIEVENSIVTLDSKIDEINENLTAFDVDTQTYSTETFKFAKSGENLGMLDSEGNFMAFGGGGNITDFIKEGILSLCGISQYTSNNNGFNLGVISPGLYLFGIFSRNSDQVLNGITGGTAIKTIQGKTSDNYTSYEIGLLFSYGDGYVTTNITTNISSSSFGAFNLFAIPIMPYCANVDYAQLYRESKISLDIDNAIINVSPDNTDGGLTLEQTIGKGKFLIITFAGMNNATETTHTVTYSDCSVLTSFKQGTTISPDRGNYRTAYEASIVDGLSDSSKVSYYSRMDNSNDNSRVIIAIPIRDI